MCGELAVLLVHFITYHHIPVFIQKPVHLIVINPLLQLILYLLSLVHVDFEFVGFVAQSWCRDALHAMSRVHSDFD